MSNELREFLASRRALISPEQAGSPRYGTHRRVAPPNPAPRHTTR